MTNAHPVLVGGSGRSGTTVLGGLISQHSVYAGVPFEVRIHLLLPRVKATGQMTPQVLRDEVMKRWRSHLHRMVPEPRLERIVSDFVDRYEEDRASATRRFIRALMDPVARAADKPSWVEMTPSNAMSASSLVSALPRLRLVHALRDGRDVAASVASTWGKLDPEQGLEWWVNRLRQIDRDMHRLPENGSLTLRLEALVRDDREGTYSRLLTFLGVDDEAPIRRFFEQTLVPERANLGRWANGLGSAERQRLSAKYREALTDLHEHGVSWAPSPDEVA